MMNLDILTASRYLKVYNWYTKNFNDDQFIKSISPNQIKPKLWMVDQLSKIPELNSKKVNVEIVGAWFGWPLIQLLENILEFDKIEIFDLDKNACRVCYQYRNIFEYSKNQIGVTNKNYWDCVNRKSNADLIINCSSEHMNETFYQYNIYKKNCIFAIQSNNMFDEPDHINCSKDINELIEKNRIKEIFYSGEMSFNDLNENSNYKRFMVIGKL